MKFFHTADWHLGKLVQGVYMTEDQREVLRQFVAAIEEERPDAVIIAGDLYDRAIPPTEAVELLDEVLKQIVIDLGVPVLAISGNHDSPDRLSFGTAMMEAKGLYLVGQLRNEMQPVVLKDAWGEVHVHLVPYADPSYVRHLFQDETIRTHDDAMRAIVERLQQRMDPEARHIFVGHAFVTATGQAEANTSDSERPLSIGGAEHVRAEYLRGFHYSAFGHLHQAHKVLEEKIRYAGSPLKYSISEEHHAKGFYVVELDGEGSVHAAKRELKPLRDMRRVSGYMEDIEQHPVCEDYVFVTLWNENPVLYPMEKVRAVYPNALHVERRPQPAAGAGASGDGTRLDQGSDGAPVGMNRRKADPVELFASFYQEVKGMSLGEEQKRLFAEVWSDVLREEGDAG